MANYSIAVNSKFKPFSFDRYMQPIAIYANMYEKKQAELQQQMITKDLLASMVDPELDKETYEGLQRYNETLNKMADIMSTVGLRGASSKDFMNLWHQYASDVAPIEKMIQRRNEDIAKQDAQSLQANGNIIFTKDARKTSLDYYKSGRPLDYSAVNLNTLLSEISNGIQAISKRNIATGMRPLGDYMESFKTQGYADLGELMAKSQDARDFINNTLNKYGFDSDKFTPEDRQRMLNTVQEGATAGLFYDTNSSYVQNPRAIKELEYDIWQRQQEWNKANNPEWKKNELEYAKAAGALGGDEDAEAERDYTFMEAQGRLSSYTNTYDAITYKDHKGALRASYFGKNFVNPIKVYDEIEKATAGYRTSNAMAAASSAKGGYSSAALQAENNKKEAEVKAKIMKKYGVTQVLTKQQYDDLKALGFSSKSTMNDFRNDFMPRINKKGVEYNHSSVALPTEALDVESDILMSNLSSLSDQWKKSNGLAWEINPDGTKGKPIKYLGKTEFDPSKSKLKDIYYSVQEPDKLHIVLSDSNKVGGDRRMYVNPSVFGDGRITRAVEFGSELLKLNDMQLLQALSAYYGVDASNTTPMQARAFVQSEVIKSIRAIVKAYNKGRGKTDSKE